MPLRSTRVFERQSLRNYDDDRHSNYSLFYYTKRLVSIVKRIY